ncbi:winged helix-turn-helix transcriptional regulator [Marinibaculum pumilum]|uniref:Winged helix-turn-helix transcriptional regulator n=1 Tax=Marinibaculum pumilum TaxID=1766165 RepID=A0ABV7KXZ9_9PROT
MTEKDSDPALTLGLLSEIEAERSTSQRRLAGQLGVALGLTNAYLKRCINKGWIKVRQVPARRCLYYLTPQGFAEKTRLTREYLESSFQFFRVARQECTDAFAECQARGWTRVVLLGAGDLAEVAVIAAHEAEVELVAVVDPARNRDRFAGLPLLRDLPPRDTFDAVLVTDVIDPQARFAAAIRRLPPQRVMTPALLHVSRGRGASDRGRAAGNEDLVGEDLIERGDAA